MIFDVFHRRTRSHFAFPQRYDKKQPRPTFRRTCASYFFVCPIYFNINKKKYQAFPPEILIFFSYFDIFFRIFLANASKIEMIFSFSTRTCIPSAFFNAYLPVAFEYSIRISLEYGRFSFPNMQISEKKQRTKRKIVPVRPFTRYVFILLHARRYGFIPPPRKTITPL